MRLEGCERLNFRKYCFAILVCCLLLISSCSAKSATEDSISKEKSSLEPTVTEMTFPEVNIIRDNNDVGNIAFKAESNATTPLSSKKVSPSYSFEMNCYGETYMINVESSEDRLNLIVTVEDCSFNSSKTTLEMTEDKNYLPRFPEFSNDYEFSLTLLKNDFDEQSVPDILRVRYCLTYFSTDTSLPYEKYKYFTVKDGNLVEIKIYDFDENLDESIVETDAISSYDCESDFGTQELFFNDFTEQKLIQIEPTIFIHEPVVKLQDDNTFKTDINFYFFDVVENSFTKVQTDLENEPLSIYSGYSYKAIYDELASYFTTADSLEFDTRDSTTYIVEDSKTGVKENFYEVDDDRFSSMDELMDYLKLYFSEDIATRLIKNSSLKLMDIQDKLCMAKPINLDFCWIDGNKPDNIVPMYSETIITGALVSDDDLNSTVTYYTVCDKYDNNGKLISENEVSSFQIMLTDESAQGFIFTEID